MDTVFADAVGGVGVGASEVHARGVARHGFLTLLGQHIGAPIEAARPQLFRGLFALTCFRFCVRTAAEPALPGLARALSAAVGDG